MLREIRFRYLSLGLLFFTYLLGKNIPFHCSNRWVKFCVLCQAGGFTRKYFATLCTIGLWNSLPQDFTEVKKLAGLKKALGM